MICKLTDTSKAGTLVRTVTLEVEAPTSVQCIDTLEAMYAKFHVPAQSKDLTQ